MDRNDGDGVDTVVLVVVAIVASLGLAVWLGAVLVAGLSGVWLGAGPAGVVEAVPVLVRSPGDPVAAWPTLHPGTSVSAVWYWSATGLVAAVAVGLVGVGVWWWLVRTGRDRRVLETAVRARLVGPRELAPLVIPAAPPPPGRLVLGTVGGKVIATEDRHFAPPTGRAAKRAGDRGSVLVVGTTRSGKSVLLSAALATWRAPCVVVSVKADLTRAIVNTRQAMGEVRAFDPTGTVTSRSDFEIGEVRWSPLRAITSPLGGEEAAKVLASSLPSGDSKLDFWTGETEKLLAGLLIAARLHPEADMGTVARWAMQREMPTNDTGGVIVDILDYAEKSPDPVERALAAHARMLLTAVWEGEPRWRDNQYQAAQSAVRAWLDPTIARSSVASEEGWVDLSWVLGGGERPRTLVLATSLEHQQLLKPALGGVLSDLKNQLQKLEATGNLPRQPMVMVIDEAAQIPLDWLPEIAATCAGLGLLLVTVWQDLAQIEATYGTLARSLINNHTTKLFFSGQGDLDTLRYVSAMLGETDVEATSTTHGTHRADSTSISTHREALAPLDVLRRASDGTGVVIHGRLDPAHFQVIRPWTDTGLLRRLNPDYLPPPDDVDGDAQPARPDVVPDLAAPGPAPGVAGRARNIGAGALTGGRGLLAAAGLEPGTVPAPAGDQTGHPRADDPGTRTDKG